MDQIAKYNPLALKLLMWLMGILLVAGSASLFAGSSFLGFDTWFGVGGSMAGAAFGAGIMIAGFNPEANVSWVRALILYCILEVIYEIFDQITLSHFNIVAFIVAVGVGVVVLVIYPNKQALFMGGMGKAKAA